MCTFEVYKDLKEEFRFRLKAGNGQLIAVSHSYKTKSGCLQAIESIKKVAPLSPVVEVDL